MATPAAHQESPSQSPQGAREGDKDRLTVDLPLACAALGISRTLGYELVRRGEFPVAVIRCGRRVLVPVHAICERLGIVPRPGEVLTADQLETLVFGTEEQRDASRDVQ